MKNLIIIFSFFICFSVASARGETRIADFNGRPMLIANGQPMLMLGGEVGNSAATCPADIRENFSRISSGGLNTVLVPVSWDLIEPTRGLFDFALVDSIIDIAERCNLKVGILWFGAWKNSMSCYTPEWVKTDFIEFPRAITASGKPLEIVSAFSEKAAMADLNAFTALLNHIKKYDSNGTVILVQVENEIGMLEDARDHSPLAQAEYKRGVPSALMKHLEKNEASLHQRLRDKWTTNGRKTAGYWTDVFGNDVYTDEIFMAWNYARYVERLASAGKKILNMPFYVNAALDSRGRKPGEYPSAGPLAHLKDVWHAAAPSVDFLSPDIYDTGFENWVAQYALPDNVLFVPEVRRGLENGAQAYYIIGHHNALGISPFAINDGTDEYFSELAKAYLVLAELTPLLANQPAGTLREGVLLSPENPSTAIDDDSVKITLSHFFTLPWDPRAADKNNWNAAGGILLKLAPYEYILAGSGLVAVFEHVGQGESLQNLGEDGFATAGQANASATASGAGPRIGLAKVEEVKINPDGSFDVIRTFNGDETHQGRHARIGVDNHKILHIKTYKYE